ncbi:unnamed protein product [[Actinomadura] parvosata subsp. kistnae]|nr:unnamed protein product [Actinomadura parvosata subsp. kistnae]
MGDAQISGPDHREAIWHEGAPFDRAGMLPAPATSYVPPASPRKPYRLVTRWSDVLVSTA